MTDCDVGSIDAIFGMPVKIGIASRNKKIGKDGAIFFNDTL
jgi:hypothetical protein